MQTVDGGPKTKVHQFLYEVYENAIRTRHDVGTKIQNEATVTGVSGRML